MGFDPATITAAMAVLGPLIQAFSGNKGKEGSTYSKGQRSFIDQILEDLKGMRGSQNINQNPNFQTGENFLQSMFNDPEFFQRFEAPAMRQFNEEIIPGIANRFASMGSGGALGSTGFRNSINRAGSDLATNLAAMRAGMQQQAVPQLLQYAQQPFSNYLSMANLGLTPTNNVYQQGSAGF